MKLLAPLTLLLACGGRRAPDPEAAWAVGTTIGGGSVLVGPSPCTYQAPPEVAELIRDGAGAASMARLIGPGEVTEVCPSETRRYPVLKASALRLDGPSTLQVGQTRAEDRYEVTPLADGRPLLGVRPSGTSPEWSLGPDCAGVAEFGPVYGSRDTGGPEVTRTLVPVGAGTCSLSATLLGLTVSRRVAVTL